MATAEMNLWMSVRVRVHDDDEVVAFVDESDSEPEVPVNTPVNTHTRAGRLSIPNSRYLDWLA